VSAPAPTLSVEGLAVAFRAAKSWRPVVEDVSFSIGAGETVAVVGESGSGKSVTALAIMRLLPEPGSLTKGRILLEGRDLLALSEPEMRHIRGNRIGMIFQEPMTSLNPVLTVGFQVKEALLYHRGLSDAAAEAEALRLFERVRIPDARRRFGQYPHTFSGGMRQRIMIAIALACQPRLLIADEPTTALDVTIQAEILELLAELRRETGTAVLFITHDMGVVAEIADSVVVMHQGKLVESGPVREIFAAPRRDYTRMLLAAVPKLGDMHGIDGPQKFAAGTPIRAEAPASATSESKDHAPLLTVENLVTRFRVAGGLFGRTVAHVHAVENVSFTLGSGETLALVGESGCGKSTTGRSIIRLVEPTSGAVRFEGEDILARDKAGLQAARRRIQMIFQDPFGSLDPRQTVGSAIAEPIRVHGLAGGSEVDDRVAHLLRRVGLAPDQASRFPHEFSGGQRQRLAIARALALSPRLVIADEAVSALDVSIKAQVLDLLIDLQEEFDLSYLFISHDMAAVERVSHRIAVMYLGEIVEIGPRAAIIEAPHHPYTQKLLAAVPIPDPSRRRTRRTAAAADLQSPLRPTAYVPPTRQWREVGPGHFVQVVGAA
jgi:peptide/nickel transport system ATP-binding protein